MSLTNGEKQKQYRQKLKEKDNEGKRTEKMPK